ncbi:C2H2 finger domain-containing protein [Stachybotrys elegans]|uniref:C2H2 finger domain-containing protein n=1 Tax=Stachybotrys elegans TaxID=80388 RepID=A0A8K0WTL9_9HYPO|nr:C2H2 finger domain-containing protein [Stachybotrys elegans]
MGVTNKRTLTKTRRKLRDIDQIKEDLLSAKHLSQYKNSKAPEDLPGLGRHYCVECAKWFDTEHTLVAHRRGKPHRRRVKQLREEPTELTEAEAAALGKRVDNGKRDAPTDTIGDVEMAT